MFFNYAYINNRRDRDATYGSFVNAPSLLRVLLQRLLLIIYSDDKLVFGASTMKTLLTLPLPRIRTTRISTSFIRVDETLETSWRSLLKSIDILSVAIGAVNDP
jgi:hypothetical protein